MGLTVLRIPSNQSASNSAKADLFMVNIKHRGERLRERWDAGFSDSVSWEGGGAVGTNRNSKSHDAPLGRVAFVETTKLF